jgi:hypothetical protein
MSSAHQEVVLAFHLPAEAVVEIYLIRAIWFWLRARMKSGSGTKRRQAAEEPIGH